MKIKMVASQLLDGEIQYISLVENGANRSPFKIMKAETAGVSWEEMMSTLQEAVARSETVCKKDPDDLVH